MCCWVRRLFITCLPSVSIGTWPLGSPSNTGLSHRAGKETSKIRKSYFRMTKITISVVWIISALLAFPPLVYEHMDPSQVEVSNSSTCSPATSNDVYIIFSALVSFILPAVLMVFLNIRIFQTVAESRRLPVLPGKAASSEDVSTLLRIHRGDAKNTATVVRVSSKALRWVQRTKLELKSA